MLRVSKCKPFHQIILKFGKAENQVERKFMVRNCRNCGYTSRGCSHFLKFLKMLLYWPSHLWKCKLESAPDTDLVTFCKTNSILHRVHLHRVGFDSFSYIMCQNTCTKLNEIVFRREKNRSSRKKPSLKNKLNRESGDVCSHDVSHVLHHPYCYTPNKFLRLL